MIRLHPPPPTPSPDPSPTPALAAAGAQAGLAALLVCAAFALPGCALLENRSSPEGTAADAATPASGTNSAANTAADTTANAAQADAATASGSAGKADKTAAAQPAFDIRVEAADSHLRETVQHHSSLLRYRDVADLEAAELDRLMVLAERDTRNLLGAQGHFSPTVTLRREDGNSQGGGSGKTGARPTIVIAIEAGPAARVSSADIAFAGEIAATADADALAQRRRIQSEWALPAGKPFTQEDWAGAKKAALAALVQRRWPRGQIADSAADVDAAQAAVALRVRLDSGPAHFLGAPQVKGASRYPEWLAPNLSWLKAGDVYDQRALVEAQQRLAGSGYYDSAYIGIDPDGAPEATPVIYNLTEAKRHKLQTGLGYSTDGGARLSLEHRDNTVFGTRWRLASKLNLNQKEPLLQTELTSMPNALGWRWGGLARYMRQDDGTLKTTSQTLRAGRMQSIENYDRHFYVQYDHASVSGSGSAVAPQALLGDGAAISGNYVWTARRFDNLLSPTGGHGLGLELGAGMTTVRPRKPFARINARALGIWPLARGKSRLTLRGELGAVLAADDARLPSTYLFRTGGDSSVRGYAYRSIGMDVGHGLIGPARYQAVGSVQWQRPFMQERFGNLLEHAVFVDVGAVANRMGDLRAHWGVGTGVRLNTPVGPMSLDVAYGLKTHQFRLHMVVGFTF